MVLTEAKPDAKSADYEHMSRLWQAADDVLEGVEALRRGREKYLPKQAGEVAATYEGRLANTKFTNIYSDVLEGLAVKPFAEEVRLGDGAASAPLQALAKNIDARGTTLHQFAAESFRAALHHGLDWILVDFTKAQKPTGRALSVAEEREQGLRPYWRRVPATAMIRLRTGFVAGEEVVVHAAYREDAVEADGFGEVVKKRVRVYDRQLLAGEDRQPVAYGPPTYALYEEQIANGRKEWVVIDEGQLGGMPVIPLVPVLLGRRQGCGWRVDLPLRAAVEQALELYLQESNLKWLSALVAFPMLAGNGISPEMEGGRPKPLGVGPHKVLYAPPTGENGQHGDWKYVEPAAQSLTFLASQIEDSRKQMRELGRQPLIEGQLTVVQSALVGQKVNTQIEAWAVALQLALEQAFKLTAMWLQDPSRPELRVKRDYTGELLGASDVEHLLSMRQTDQFGDTPDLSRRTLWSELQRRGVLAETFTAEEEERRLLAEVLPHLEVEENLRAAAGEAPRRDAA